MLIDLSDSIQVELPISGEVVVKLISDLKEIGWVANVVEKLSSDLYQRYQIWSDGKTLVGVLTKKEFDQFLLSSNRWDYITRVN